MYEGKKPHTLIWNFRIQGIKRRAWTFQELFHKNREPMAMEIQKWHDLRMRTLETTWKWSNAFKILKEKQYPPRIQNPSHHPGMRIDWRHVHKCKVNLFQDATRKCNPPKRSSQPRRKINMESNWEDTLASLQDAPKWALAPGIHAIVQFPLMLDKDWSVWPIGDGRNNNLSLLRSGYKRHRAFDLGRCLVLFLESLALGEASCHEVSSPIERPIWWGTRSSGQEAYA